MASREETQDLSNETETVELSSEDDRDEGYDENEPSETPKKKGGLGKILGIAGAVVAVGAIGYTVTQMMSSPTPPPQAQNQAAKPSASVPVETTKEPVPVAAPTPQVSQTPVATAQTQAPTPVQSTPQVSNGEEALPDLNKGNVVSENPNDESLGANVTPSTTSPVATPDNATPSQDDNPSVDMPDLGNSSVSQMPPVGQNVTQTPTTQAPVSTTPSASGISDSSANDLNKSINALIQKMDGLQTSIESLNNMIGDTNTRIDKTNTNVDNLTKRVDKLEELIKDKSTTSVAPAVVKKADSKPVVKKSTTKAVVKKKRVSSGVSNARYNSVVIIDEDASPRASRKVHHVRKAPSEASSRLGGGYKLQSVVTDRAWVKSPGGVTSTYGIGDRMPNGSVVGSIDPDNGVYDTNGKLILK